MIDRAEQSGRGWRSTSHWPLSERDIFSVSKVRGMYTRIEQEDRAREGRGGLYSFHFSCSSCCLLFGIALCAPSVSVLLDVIPPPPPPLSARCRHRVMMGSRRGRAESQQKHPISFATSAAARSLLISIATGCTNPSK